jgi:hypothetical protein
VLAAESGNSVTLLAPDGKEHVILRSDLEELVSSGRSVMPEGLEKELPQEAMADLIAYIRSVGPAVKPKQIAGNRPALVKADDKGALLLTAINAEIHGKTLTFEEKHQNLGYWTSEDDRAAWEVDVPRAGRYEIWLDWACPDTSAGKPFVLETGGQRFTGKVEATKGWDDFRQERVGALVLAAGMQRCTLNHGRTLNGSALLDLRSVKLVPVGPE